MGQNENQTTVGNVIQTTVVAADKYNKFLNSYTFSPILSETVIICDERINY